MNVLVVGGGGGIGGALVRAYLAHPGVEAVIATCHRQGATFTHPRLTWRALDVSDEDQVAGLAAGIPSLQRLINCVGVLHGDGWNPEKTVQSVDPAFFLRSVEVNTLPTLLLAKHFAKALRGGPSVFATLSAKVGSIGDNRLGGWYSYRVSKAALNMALKTLALEWRVKLPHCCVAAIHPGTTETALSEPFGAQLARVSPAATAARLHSLIEGLTSEQTGRFWHWDGSELPW